MGWKNVKEHYRIKHIVMMRDGDLYIGSPYIHDIIVVGADGVSKKRYTSESNDELWRYQKDIDADPAKFVELLRTEDHFERSLPVYTYEDDLIIERQCEKTGWPNITHDGDLMYENTYSTDRSTVVGWMLDNARAGVSIWERHIAESEERLAKNRGKLEQARSILGNIERNHVR